LTFILALYIGASVGLLPRASADNLSISGTLWLDENADGTRQANEPGLEHKAVILRSSDGIEIEVISDAPGKYTFTGLEAGSYVVAIKVFGVGTPLIMTHPTRKYLPPFEQRVVLEDAPVQGVGFGLHDVTRDRLPRFIGLAWINAEPVDDPEVTASIDGVNCTGSVGLLPTDLDLATYSVSVLSADLKPGCGKEGDTVGFEINGAPASQEVEWTLIPEGEAPLQDGRGRLELTVGQPFAYLYPTILQAGPSGEPEGAYGRTVVALIDGKVCGVGLHRVWGSILLAIPSEEQEAGCGQPGVEVSFAVDGFAVPETLTWSPGGHEGFTFTLNPSPDGPFAGPPFAYYTVDLAPRPPDFLGQFSQHIEAWIDGVSCGAVSGEGPAEAVLLVAPDELVDGCGREGATVTVTLDGRPFGQPVAWAPGFHEGPDASSEGGQSPPPATPTPGGSQITPPDTGSAGLNR
jgi:hypothetical protein